MQPRKPECGAADRSSRVSIFGGNGLLRTRVAALSGGRDAGWHGRLAEVDEDVADGGRVGDEGDDPLFAAAQGQGAVPQDGALEECVEVVLDEL